MPPIWTRRCALARRRSSAAACTDAAVSTLVQNAWIDTRGAGAIKSSIGAGAGSASSVSAVRSESFMSVPDVADLALVLVWIVGRRALTLAILVEHDRAARLVGRCLAA